MMYWPLALGASAGPALIPRAIMGRSPEALAFGSRRHFIPASLSLPLCGCLLNRSRDGAMLTLLRLPLSAACASLRHDLRQSPGEENWKLDPRYVRAARSVGVLGTFQGRSAELI